MDKVAEKKHVHQGENVKLARGLRGFSQEELASRLGIDQSKYSRTIEQKDTIDDEILNRIAAELEVSVDFLKTFELEKAATYNVVNAETINLSDNATGANTVGHDLINNYPLTEVTELTTKLLDMQKEHYEKEMLLLKESCQKDTEIALLK